MDVTTPTRVGQINLTGDAFALFLKKFAGEVLTEFEVRQVMMGLHTVRTIENGKSAQFPVSGRATAKRHAVGEDILDASNAYLSQIGMAEKIIYIDDPLLASTFIPSIDEAMSHYDVRSIYTRELGRALAYQFDKDVLQTAVLAARASAAVTGGSDGDVIAGGADVATNANDALVDAILEALQILDEKSVPEEDRVVILRPDLYWTLLKSDKVINRDFGGSGSIASGKVWELGGARIVKSNHLPSTDMGTTQDTGVRNTYKADFSDTVALVLQKEAVGTVKLRDIAVEQDYEIRNQGNLFVSKYAMGHGILRPECAVEISKASS